MTGVRVFPAVFAAVFFLAGASASGVSRSQLEREAIAQSVERYNRQDHVVLEPCQWQLARRGGKKARNRQPSRDEQSSAAPATLNPFTPPPVEVRDPNTTQELVVMGYNVLNLDQHIGSYKPDLHDGGKLRRISNSEKKPERHIIAQAQILKDLKVDVGIFPEVESRFALDVWSLGYLGGMYDTGLIDGNDPRGIDVGMMVHRSLGFTVEARTNKTRTWYDEIQGRNDQIFSRDLVVFIYRLPGEKKPFLIALGKHYKSKRTRSPDDIESRIKRKAEADETAVIVAELAREFGLDAPIVVVGDDNGVWTAEQEYASMKRALEGVDPSAGDMVDAFDLVKPRLTPSQRITHSYHPRGGKTSYSQLDSIIVAPGIQHCIKRAFVYRYKNAKGEEIPIPTNIEERKRNPSDHFPIVAVFDFQCLMKVMKK